MEKPAEGAQTLVAVVALRGFGALHSVVGSMGLFGGMLSGRSLQAPVSGFSVDGSVHLAPGTAKAREAPAQYVPWPTAGQDPARGVRPPIRLQRLLVDEGGTDTVICRSPCSDDYLNADTEVFPTAEYRQTARPHHLSAISKTTSILTAALSPTTPAGAHPPAHQLVIGTEGPFFPHNPGPSHSGCIIRSLTLCPFLGPQSGPQFFPDREV